MGNKQSKQGGTGLSSRGHSPSLDSSSKKQPPILSQSAGKQAKGDPNLEKEINKMTKIPQNEIKSKDSRSQQSVDNMSRGGVKRSNSVAESSSKSRSSGDIASKNIPHKGKSAFGRKSQKNLPDDISEYEREIHDAPGKPKTVNNGPKKGNSKLSLMDSHGSKTFGRRESLAPPSKSNSKRQSESEVIEPEILQEDVEEEIEEEEVPMESQNYSSMAKKNMKKMPQVKTSEQKQKKQARKMLKKNRTTMSYKGIYNQFADLDEDKHSAYNFDDMFGTVIHDKIGLVSKRTNKSSHMSLWSNHKDVLQKLDEEADELLQSVDRSMRNFSLSRASSGAPSTLYGQSSMNGPTLKAMMNLISVNEFLPRSMTHYSNRGRN